jgi:hypothetical protein
VVVDKFSHLLLVRIVFTTVLLNPDLMQISFTHLDHSQSLVVQKNDLLVSVCFTPQLIAEALLRAKRRNVAVGVIAEKSQSHERITETKSIKQSGKCLYC